MAAGPIGQRPAQQDSRRRRHQKDGQHRIGRPQAEAVQLHQGGYGKCLYAGADHADGHKEHKEHHHRPVEVELQSGAVGNGIAGSAVMVRLNRHFVLEHAAVKHQGNDNGNRRKADGNQGPAPAHPGRQQDHHHRCRHKTDVAGKGMQSEGPAQHLPVDGGGENGVIGGMENAVAQTRNDHQDNHHPVRTSEADQADPHTGQHQTPDQDQLRPITVDQHAGRHLEDRRHQVHQGNQQAEGGIADSEFFFQQGKQRWQAQEVEMTEAMAGPDQSGNRPESLPFRDTAHRLFPKIDAVPDAGSALHTVIGITAISTLGNNNRLSFTITG